ncbi:hypothetical protein ACQKCH_03840 [Nubsella zeaxanthinifaciens]|uniref:hypothetical protein n=1 Tax=Nubsella zeaxanthinifaciens TaxID=392412 RepID=UPI003D02F3C6
MNENLHNWLNRQNELYQKISGPSVGISAMVNSHAKTMRSLGISNQVLHIANKVNALNKPLDHYRQLANIVYTRKDISQRLGILGSHATMLDKSFLRNQTTINALFPTSGLSKLLSTNSGLSHLLTKSQGKNEIFKTPMMSSIFAMGQRYEGLFKSSFAIQQAMGPGLNGSLATQLGALQHSLAKVDVQALRAASFNADWEAMEEYESITQEVADLVEQGITEQQAALEQLWEKVVAFYHRNKNLGRYTYEALTVIGLIAGLYAFIDDKILDKPAPLTLNQYQADQLAAKQERALEREHILQEIRKVIDYRHTKDLTPIKLKPYPKSTVLLMLGASTEVQVLQSKGRWAFVSFEGKDGLPQTGWVLKKYLIRK